MPPRTFDKGTKPRKRKLRIQKIPEQLKDI